MAKHSKKNEQKRMAGTFITIFLAAPLVASYNESNIVQLLLGWGLVGLSIIMALWSRIAR